MAKQVYNRIFDEEKWKLVNQENKDIVTDFLQEMKAQKKSAGTIKQYANDLRILNLWVYEKANNKSLLDLKKRDFRNFVLHATDEWNMSNARVNRLMSAVRMLTSFLEDDEDEYEDYERSAAAKIKGLPKQPVRDIDFISNENIQKLYDKLMKEERYKEATLLGILYDSGCRKNEILQVERDSIADDKNASNKVVGKRGKIFPALYFNHTKKAFEKYNATRTDDSPMLFVTNNGKAATASNLYGWVVAWKEDLEEICGITYDNLNCHTFRHCYIENMTNGTHWLCKELKLGKVEIQQVKVLVHHSDVSTTDNYRSNDEEREIQELLGIKL